MPTKMEMDSAHTIEAQGSGRWDFLKRVCTLAEQIAMICCQCQGAGKSGSVGAPPIAMTARELRVVRNAPVKFLSCRY